MTNNSGIARLIEALKNVDAAGVESKSLPARDIGSTACPGSQGASRSAASRAIEYVLITTYVSVAALIFVPPYFTTMSHIVSKLLRSF